MIAEKPSWLRHEGLQIFSIDIQPGGHRFSTAGGDHKVRIWDMKYLSRVEVDAEPSTSKLLATLHDHFGSVNCVRWAKKGHLIASGSDDTIILIHERRPGSGTAKFGSGEPPDVENWKVVMTLRGHTADVVDLGWCPDDSLLASCSLDNTVRVWDMKNGSPVTVLQGHTSLVKGISWDPIGSFLASQSDDKTVIIWRTTDWTLTQQIKGHWEKSVGSTFFRRLDWSPCGHFITTTNGFQKPRHSAPVLERSDWTASFDFLGHNAPVVVVRFNHSLFRKYPQFTGTTGENGTADHDGHPDQNQKNGGTKSKEKLPYNVIAMGSQDCSITVWTTTSARPIFVGKHFFTQSVVDLSWSPDGYSLLCCSLDGSIAAFHFEVKELGYKFSVNEMEDLKKNRYGDTCVRQTKLAESPAQLMLESLAAKQSIVSGSQPTNQVSVTPDSANSTKLQTSATIETTSRKTLDNPVTMTVLEKEKKPKVSSPVKQREYIRPDGRRRIIPEPIGPQVKDERMGMNGSHAVSICGRKRDSSAMDGLENLAPAKDSRTEPLPKGGQSTAAGERIENAAKLKAASSSIFTETGFCSIDAMQTGVDLPCSGGDIVIAADNQQSKNVLSLTLSLNGDDDFGLPICLETRSASNVSSNRLDSQETEVICSRGGEIQWQDRLLVKVVSISGNSKIWVVGCSDGTLQVYTRCGRRAMPPLILGSAPVFLDCDKDSKFMVLTRYGALYMWECVGSKCLLKESVLPLLTASTDSSKKVTMKVISARISKSGAPLVILTNRHAFLFHMGMQCWQRIADDKFRASSFFSTLQDSSHSGCTELVSLQAAAAAADASVQGRQWNLRFIDEDKSTTRAHLELQLASAIALKSPQDYKSVLLTYARFLARQADEVRLRELSMELLGPSHIGPGSDGFNASANLTTWEPEILGLSKEELLKSVVLPAMASNRNIQRLLNELMDLLSEKETLQRQLKDSLL